MDIFDAITTIQQFLIRLVLCKPAGLAVYDPNVCHCGYYDGNGYNCFNLGSVMWALPSLLRRSKDLLEKKKAK
jgi:hypothetical protein